VRARTVRAVDVTRFPARIATRRSRPAPVVRAKPIAVRRAEQADATVIHALIVEHLAEGHLLPRDRGEIAVHAHRFAVAEQGGTVLACAELAPLSRTVAEIRSFVVTREARSLGVGRRLIETLFERAQASGFEKLCAFTHSPGYFVHLGFSIVPHVWLPEKVATDCHGCYHFRRCGQHAVLRSIPPARQVCVPLASLHG
jgi:amino-acid N-acetyltransferase